MPLFAELVGIADGITIWKTDSTYLDVHALSDSVQPVQKKISNNIAPLK